jgi:hypothetical protein
VCAVSRNRNRENFEIKKKLRIVTKPERIISKFSLVHQLGHTAENAKALSGQLKNPWRTGLNPDPSGGIFY